MKRIQAIRTSNSCRRGYRELHTKKIQADTNLENANRNLAALKERGPPEVQHRRCGRTPQEALHDEGRERRETEELSGRGLDRIETELAAVEKNLGSTEDAESDSEEES